MPVLYRNDAVSVAAGGSVIVNATPIVIPSTDVAWIGVMGTDHTAGVQLAPDGGAIQGADGLTFVFEETATAGQVNVRATNLNALAARAARVKVLSG